MHRKNCQNAGRTSRSIWIERVCSSSWGCFSRSPRGGIGRRSGERSGAPDDREMLRVEAAVDRRSIIWRAGKTKKAGGPRT